MTFVCSAPQFYVAWLVVAIIWLWATLLIAGIYPIIDGGIDQIKAVYKGLKAGRASSKTTSNNIIQSPTPVSSDHSAVEVNVTPSKG